MRLQSLTHLVPAYLLYVSIPILQVLSQETQKNIINDETDAFINQVLTEWNSPGGIAVAVVRKDSQGKWATEMKGYGLATAGGRRVDEKTLFAIASNSKLFTVSATGLLVHNETLFPRLSWTSKIAAVIPGWGLMDSDASKQATLLDAMSHRTGLPRHDLMYRWSDDVVNIVQRMKYLRPSAEFRDIWQYTNTMYMLLSSLPPLLLPSKTPFSQYVTQNIFSPLGMDSTTYSPEKASLSGLMADGLTREGVNVSGNPLGDGKVRIIPFWPKIAEEDDGHALAGAGGIISNAEDMAIWLQTLLLNGKNPKTGETVIPAEVLDKAATGITVPAGKAPFPELSPVVYGGGQARSTYRGHEIIEHGGNVPGFNSQVTRLPYDNLGVAVLSNDNQHGTYIMEIIKSRILDDALRLERLDWNTRYKAVLSSRKPSDPTPRPANVTLPPVEFTNLVGTYTNGGYGTFELCLVSPTPVKASPACSALASNVSTILPGAVDPKVPTFLAAWDSPWASHVRLAHFNDNIFNVSLLSSFPTDNPAEPYWVYDEAASGNLAEYADGGIGFTGVWGAAGSVAPLQGKTVRDRAEVWFNKKKA